jgi:NTE family protein
LRKTLERHVDFGELRTPMKIPAPMLLIGAVDVLSGKFRAFNSRRDRISSDTILASTALPTLFRAVRAFTGTASSPRTPPCSNSRGRTRTRSG